MAKYNPNSIWESKKKEDLYTPSKKPASTPKAPPGVKSSPVNPTWEDEVEAPPKTAPAQPASPAAARPTGSVGAPPSQPFFKKRPIEEFDEPAPKRNIVLWSAVGLIVLAGVVVLYIFLRPATGPNVGMAFSESTTQVLTGEPFTLTVTISNYSASVLSGATLSVQLPSDGSISFAGQPSDTRVSEQTLGDVGAGQITPEPFTLIVTGDPNSVQNIVTKLTYGTGNSSKAEFETDGTANIVVGGPAISLNITSPQNVFSGQNFDTDITYTNNTSQTFNDVELTLEYPPVFSYAESTVQPDTAANDSWNLGNIPPSGTGSITLTGNVVGPQGAAYSFDGALNGEVSGDTYTLTNQTTNFAIATSPLTLSLALNGSSSTIVHAGDDLTYTISYTNTSNVTFQNLAVKATLVGAMFDLTSLQSNGSFNSITDTVSWNGANTPALLTLAPGQSGSVNFTIAARSTFPIKLLSDKNYMLAVNATISSPTVPPGTAASSTVSAANIQTKVGGAIVLATTGYWRDAPSGILNSGPYPPKVNQATEYTIHWTITNYSTDASNVTVSAYLQSGTTCTGTIKSNLSTSPICNSSNGLITWTIPTIPATTGITGPPAEAIIQVTNTPAVNQVGSAVTLMGATTLQGTDAFTNLPFTGTGQAITTNLPDDTTIAGNVNRTVSQ